MSNTIIATDFKFPNQKKVYKGKVREVYYINDDLLVMIATDRLSAFDVVMPKGIPYKGQILNQIATSMMKKTMAGKGVASVEELRELSIEAGVNLIACQMTVDVFGYGREDFVDEVNEWVGAASFLPMAQLKFLSRVMR